MKMLAHRCAGITPLAAQPGPRQLWCSSVAQRDAWQLCILLLCPLLPVTEPYTLPITLTSRIQENLTPV